jgi:hypothetical protein
VTRHSLVTVPTGHRIGRPTPSDRLCPVLPHIPEVANLCTEQGERGGARHSIRNRRQSGLLRCSVKMLSVCCRQPLPPGGMAGTWRAARRPERPAPALTGVSTGGRPATPTPHIGRVGRTSRPDPSAPSSRPPCVRVPLREPFGAALPRNSPAANSRGPDCGHHRGLLIDCQLTDGNGVKIDFRGNRLDTRTTPTSRHCLASERAGDR